MRKILGLDISTSITGMTIIEDGKIVQSCFWDTRNKKRFPTIYHKANFIKQELQKIKDKKKINK